MASKGSGQATDARVPHHAAYAGMSRGRSNCCAKMRVIGVHSDGGMRERILLPAKQMYKCEKLPDVMIPLVETFGVGIYAVGRSGRWPEIERFSRCGRSDFR